MPVSVYVKLIPVDLSGTRLAISITRVYRHEISKRHTGVLAVPCGLSALCAAAGGHAAAALPRFLHYLLTPDVCVTAGIGFAAPRGAC